MSWIEAVIATMLTLFVIGLSLALGFACYLVLYVAGQQDREAEVQKAAMEATDRLGRAAWEARTALWESARRLRDKES